MIQEILSTQAVFVFLKWFIVVAIWLYLAVCLQHDGGRIRKHPDPTIVKLLLRGLHKRNVQIFGLVSIILIMMAASDISGYLKEQALTETEISSQEEEDAPQAAATPVPATSPSASTASSKETYSLPQNPNMPFSNITEFQEKNGKQQAYIDFLKQRYETWLVTYYYLQKCGKVGAGDLSLILGAMKRDLSNLHADRSVVENIMLASSGSYKEMYSSIPCDAAHVANTKAGYDTSMKLITQSASEAKPALDSPKQ